MNEVPQMPWWEQIIMYVGIVIGVLFSSVLLNFQVGETVDLYFSIPTLIVSSIIGVLICPIAFEKLAVDPLAPFITRFGLSVQHGVFWYVIFSSLGKAIAM